MALGQRTMVGGEGASDVARQESHYGLGWAERAEFERRERVHDIPRDALFRCAVQADADGRFRGKVETVGADERRWAYAYDGDGRLVEARLDGQIVERYAYAHEGRRIVSECRATGSGPVQYAYDGLDRMRSRGGVQFAYDADGRMVERVERGLSTRYAYDASGFLAQVLFPGGQRLTYDRGADGLLRSTWLDGQPQEEFTWLDGLRPHRWRDVPARRTLEFNYEEGRRVPSAVTVYEGGYSCRQALGADQVGTIKTVADDTGYLIKELQYDSFGNQLEDSNPGFYLPLGFAGGVRDRHTGLVRFGWRYYMPEAGRFTAPDPARWAGGDPDLYDYCVDDPIGKIDPQGLEPEEQESNVARDEHAEVVFDRALGSIIFTENGDSTRYPASGKVIGKKKGGTPYTPIEDGFSSDKVTTYPPLGKSKAYGPGNNDTPTKKDDMQTYIDTGHPQGKEIHGGGSGAKDPYADYQEMKPTHGCIRMHNKDVDMLSKRIDSFRKRTGKDVPVRVQKR